MRTIILLLALGSIASADVVYLKNGGKIEGLVTDAGETYKVDTGYGTLTLKKEEVDRIEKKEFKAPDKPVFKKTPPRLRESFAQPFYGFKIYLPNGWGIGPAKEAQRVNFYGPKEQMYTPRLDLTVKVLKMTVGDLVNGLKTGYLKDYKDVLFIYEEAMDLRGREAYQFIAAFTDGGIKMRSIWTVVGKDDLRYMLGFSCTDAWFDKYYSMVDASMRSIRVFPLPTAPLEQRKEFDKLYQQAGSLAKEGKRSEALKLFEKAAAIIPEFADLHGMIGRLNTKLGNWTDAEKAFRKALEIDPDDYDHALNLGIVLAQQQKHKQAIEALEKAVKADPQMEPALTTLGATYIAAGEPQKGVEVLKKAVLADPESPSAHHNLGVAYEQTNQPKDAEAEFKETLKLDPKHQGARDGLARLKKK